MTFVIAGLLAPVVLSACAAAWVSARAGSVLLGSAAGVIAFGATLAASLAVMFIWVRAQLVHLVETQLPLLLGRLSEWLGHIVLLKETF